MFLVFLPVVLCAQQSAAPPKPAAPKAVVAPKPAPAAPKPVTAVKPAAAPKPAAAVKRPMTPAAPKPGAAPVLKSDEDRAFYALGLRMYASIAQLDLSPAELEVLKRALSDAQAGKSVPEADAWGSKLQSIAEARSTRLRDREKANSQAYLAKAATEAGAVKTESGLVFKDITVGTGDSPKAESTVKVHYRGTLINGTEFDSSYKRNEPAEFALNRVVKCWTEGLQKMKPGGKARLVCPSDLAYGDQGRPSIPPGAALIFEVELLEVK